MIMTQKLTQKIGTAFVWTAIGLGSLVALSGCHFPQPGEPGYERYVARNKAAEEDLKEKSRFLTGGLLGMAASGAGDIGQPKRDRALRGMASGLQNSQRNDAISNSGQVNVNLGTNNNQGNNSTTQASFVCRDFKDFNGNGYIEKNELIGVGNYFKCGKEFTKDNLMPVIVGSIWENVKGQNVLTNIKKAFDGRIAYSKEVVIPSNGVIKWDAMGFYKSETDEGIEEWITEFYINGRLDPSKTMSFFMDYGKREDPNSSK